MDVTCTNPECEAYNQHVMVKLGLCTLGFNLLTDWDDRVKCPQCNVQCAHRADDTVTFFDCCWKYEGVTVDGEQRSAEGRVGRDAAYEMERRSEKGTLDALWRSLVITTRK